MKINLRQIILLAALLGAFFGADVHAQPEIPVAGGYGAVETTAAEVIAAANFAVKKQAKMQRAKIKLAAVSRAERQIVAGTNYRLCLQIEILEKNKKTAVPQTVQIVVFRSLKQKYELTSWAIAACADETPPETIGK